MTLDQDDLDAIAGLLDARLGTPVALGASGATLSGMLHDLAWNQSANPYDPGSHSLQALRTGIPSEVSSTLGQRSLQFDGFTTWDLALEAAYMAAVGNRFAWFPGSAPATWSVAAVSGEWAGVVVTVLGNRVYWSDTVTVGVWDAVNGWVADASWDDRSLSSSMLRVNTASRATAFLGGSLALSLQDSGGRTWTKTVRVPALAVGENLDGLVGSDGALYTDSYRWEPLDPDAGPAGSGGAAVLLPAMPAQQYATVSSAYEVEVVRGDGPLSLPIDLGQDCTGFDAWFAGKASPSDTAYTHAPRLCTWVDQTAGTLTVPLTQTDTAAAGRYRAEVELRQGLSRATARIFTLRITAGVMG